MSLTESAIKEWLLPIEDPEIFMSIVDLGLVYRCEMPSSDEVIVYMTLTSPGCPLGDEIIEAVKQRLMAHPEIKKASVEIIWEPQWDPREMASDECKLRLGIW